MIEGELRPMRFAWSGPPEKWRSKSLLYARRAVETTNLSRRDRYAELASLYLQKAQRIEFEKAQVRGAPLRSTP